MMKHTFLFVVLSLVVLTGYAQVSGYQFNYSMGAYTEITGGTVLATATVNGTGTNSLDEGFYTATPIPFPFAYNGLPYTDVAISCNGYIIFGGIAAMGYTPVSNTALADGAVSALGRDLQGNVDEGNLGEVRYETLGDAPNRVYVIQWKNFRRYAGVNEDYNFQIRLYETTNVIEFVYGDMLVNYTSTTHPQVGLRGMNNTDFVNRAVTTDWAASTAGTVNTAMATLSTTVFPASGTTYSYSLTVMAAPNQATLIYPAVGGWVFLDGVLKWAQAGGYPSSFDVYFGTDVNPPFVANVTTQSYTPVLAPNTHYYWRIDAVNSFGTTTGTLWNFKTPGADQLTESFESATFPPPGWLNPNAWSRSTTTPFHLTAVASKSASTTPAILATPKVTITPTSTLDFYYKPGSTNGYGRLQVVYSADRVTWNPVGPLLVMPTVSTVWISQSVDLSSIPGNYFLGFQVFTTTSTSTIAIDHVFGPVITAEAPGPVVLTAPADASVDLNPRPTFTWNAPLTGGVTQGYKIYCDTNPNPTTLLGTTGELSFLSPVVLNFGTTYYWKVVAYNATGDSSSNPVFSFTVWADPTVTVFPWSESFDGVTFAPIGWDNIKTAGTSLPGIWNRVTSGTSPTCTTHSGAGMARYNAYSIQTGGKAELITPPLDLVSGGVYELKFWMFRDSGYATKTQELVNVYVNTAPTSTGGVLLGTIHRYYGFEPIEPTANLWYEYLFTFEGSDTANYIIFEGVSEYGNNMFVDDVSLAPNDPPAPPVLVYPANNATGLPQSGFNLSWAPDLDNGDAPSYYTLFVATSEDNIFDEHVYDGITSTSFNPAADPTDPITYAFGAQYFWTVLAVNSFGEALAETINRFTIETQTLLTAPEVEIQTNASGQVELIWNAVAGAASYLVYGSVDPYAAGPWTLLSTTGNAGYIYTGTESFKFFKVVSSTQLP